MGLVTVLLSGLPSYVTLVDLSCYLEYLFNTNSEIGTFELRRLRRNDKKLVALDFPSGFDAIAAQEQLDGYRYEMPGGTQYILRAKVTNKKEYLRSDSSPESFRRLSRSLSEDMAWVPMTLMPTMSDAAMARANAKLDAKYKLLQKQKLIVQSEMELIRERRKLRREYVQAEISDSDESTSSRKPVEHRSWSQELDLFKIRLAAKIQHLKAVDSHSKGSASTSKQRSPSWDEDHPSSVRVKSKPSSRERSLREYRFGSKVRPRVRSRSLSRSSQSKSKSRERSPKYRPKSGVRSRAIRSRTLTQSPCKSKSRERSSQFKSRARVRSRALRSRSRSSQNTWSRSLSSSSRTRRSRSRIRRCRSRSRDTESRGRKIARARYRSSYKRSRSPDSGSRDKRLRSPDSRFRGERLRSPDGAVRSRRPRSRGRLLAIMPKSPAKETTDVRSEANRSNVNKSDLEITKRKKRTIRNTSPKHADNNKSNNLFGTEESKTEASNMSQINIKTKLNLPTKNCTLTGVTAKENAIKKKIKLSENTVTQPQCRKAEDNINIANNSLNTDEKQSKDTHNKTDSIEMEDVKNTNQKKTNGSVQRQLKIKGIMMQSICDDIMFLMQSLLREILIEERITLSDSNARLIKERLKLLVRQRVQILYVEEHFSILNACESYRRICTKQDDTILLKQMLDDLKTQEAELSQFKSNSQNNPPALEKAADELLENTIEKVSNVVPGPSLRTQKKSLEKSGEDKTAEVIEVIDIETYCPEEPSNKGTSSQDMPLPAHPKFVLVIKRLMKQLKPILYTSIGLGVYVTYFDMKQVLRILLKDMLQGQGYKTTSQIVALFRQIYPRDHDVDFVKKVAEDINMKKYDLKGMDEESQDDDEVTVLENKHEVVVISDDEPDDAREKILHIINSLNEMPGKEKIKDFNCNDLSDMERIEAAFGIIDPNEFDQIKEADLIVPKANEKTDVTVNNITETKESEKTITSDTSTIENTEMCNTIFKQEEENEQQLSEIVQNQDKTADTMVNQEVRETVCDQMKEELKVTAITIMTSETELHSIADAIEKGITENPKDNTIKEELDSELTDAEIDEILRLENFSLDILNATDTGACEDKILDPCEKETPQVVSVTITTTAAELLSLKYKGHENTSKEVPEVKIENREEIKNEMQEEVHDDENIENYTQVGFTEDFGNTANAEISCPSGQNKPQDKRPPEDEETIESICKYLTSCCNDLY